uniref:Nucleolar complex protein 2 homolog (inferred by orthology to a C. elegans protein) n=1 Tax=Strongyloides venezuelensis TaxID=75913 RepID=A0A0K0FK06_STRVS
MGPIKRTKKFKRSKPVKRTTKKVNGKNLVPDDDSNYQSDASVEMNELFESNDNLEDSNNCDDSKSVDSNVDDEFIDSSESIPDAQSHMKELQKLSEADPSFLKFLQEQDPDLLEFKEDDLDEEDDDSMDGDHESLVLSYGNKTHVVEYNEENKKVVDFHVIDYLKYNLLESEVTKENLVSATKILVSCFDAATVMIGRKKKRDTDWVINDNIVFKDILSLCFSKIVPIFYKILQPVSEDKAAELRIKNTKRSPADGITYFKKWRQYGSVCRKYIEAIGILINQITEDGSKKRVLRHLLDLVDLHVHFSGLSKKMIKVLCRLWCTSKEENRIMAFTVLFKMCRLDKSLYPLILKSCYMTFVTFSGYTCSQNLKSFCFMHCSFAEMVLLDCSVSYSYVFVYLQQAGTFLRNSIKSKASDRMKNVTKWQFVQGLYLWNEVIIAACKMASKLPDSHPVHGIAEQRFAFAQIVIGLYTHTQNQRYLLLRIHCLRILLKLQQSTDTYIPLLGLSIEALKDLVLIDERKPGKKEVALPDDVIDVNLRINNELNGCSEFRKLVGNELLKILNNIVNSIENAKVLDACAASTVKRMRYVIKNCKNKEHLNIFRNFIGTLETEITK